MTVTETRAAYEAAIIEAMHTQAAPVAPEPPDLEYTPIPDPLPRLVRREELDAARARVAELEDIITRKWGNPFMHMRDSAVFDALSAITAYWHVITLPLDDGGVLMRLYDPARLEKAAEFTGPLHDVVLHAAAWFDGVKFEVQP